MKLNRYFKISVLFLMYTTTAIAQESHDRNYWIERYLSVCYPLKNIKVTSQYGKRKDPFSSRVIQHKGLDLQANYDTVYAMFDGVVTDIQKENNAGLTLVLQHGKYTIIYCHLSKINVQQGDSIFAGEAVAVSGNSGKRTTGPHLHISVKYGQKPESPYSLLRYVQMIRQEAYLALVGDNQTDTNMELSPQDFIEAYAPIAMEQQKKYGIPSSVTLSQMAFESAWGQSDLARKGHNFFGIKCSQEWLNEGKAYSLHDDDKPKEKFCNYVNVRQSVEHHSKVLMGERYKQCRQFKATDYHNWLLSIKRAGYATNKNYVTLCEKIIKQYRLYRYDQLALM